MHRSRHSKVLLALIVLLLLILIAGAVTDFQF
ncbi:putative membrane protein [Corynebacterium sp. ATCC 6931]|nr:putative membrane protein [Corynebacterium sp. ATCC 6931]EPD45768.1 hypothetical protein HMPREF1206_01961 [Corynebacterium sp. HFH0082]STC40714.1 Uncharacterised protein [Corynebacterium amycolatum]